MSDVTTKVFFEALKSFPKTKKWIDSKIHEYDVFGNYCQKYSDKLEERYNSIRVFGMERPVSLRNIFVRVNILEKITYNIRVTIENLEKDFDKDRRSFGTKKQTMSGIDAINQEIYLLERTGVEKLENLPRSNQIDNVTVPKDVIINLSQNIKNIKFNGKTAYFDRIERLIGKEDFRKFQNVILKHTNIQLDNYIVLGKPGAGKTTFLKFIILQTLDGKTPGDKVPVFISLKDFSDSELDLLSFIVREFDICCFPDAKSFITRLLNDGKFLILLDGLDEVSNGRDSYVIKQVQDLSLKYSRNQFIISCRIAAYNNWFNNFIDIEIADFDENQITIFVKNWFSDENKISEICLKKIFNKIQIKDLATNPLLLTLLCLAFDETMNFPANRSELYKEAIEALLKKWDSFRRIKRDDIYKNLSLKRKESLFSNIAAETFENGMYFISQKLLEKQIIKYIKNLPQTKEEYLDLDSEVILKSIESQHGIFVQRAKNIYSFAHLTFQEYYTAQYIVSNAQFGTIDNLIDLHCLDPSWREVILLTIEMLECADTCLLRIKNKIKSESVTKNIKLTLGNLFSIFDIYIALFMFDSYFISRLVLIRHFLERVERQVDFNMHRQNLKESGILAKHSFALDQIINILHKLEGDLNIDISKVTQDTLKKYDELVFDFCKSLVRDCDDTIHSSIKRGYNKFYDELINFIRVNELLTESLNSEGYLTLTVRDEILEDLFIC